jgi:CBS domain-containing protein
LKLDSAFPHILERQYPVVKPDYPLLAVLYLLRMKDVDAVPIVTQRGTRGRAVFGFSSLPKLVTLGPARFDRLLRGPCEEASDTLVSLSVEEDLESLLETFNSSGLGVALVRGTGSDKRTGLVSLADVLRLYSSGAIRTDITTEDVGTRIFSLPRNTPIRRALQEMFRHSYRRIFLPGERTYVSDRGVMGYIFSPVVLEEIGNHPHEDILAAPLDEAEKETPLVVAPGTAVKMAALKLQGDRGGCLVTRGDKVITPWDVVMKPWLSGRLTIG